MSISSYTQELKDRDVLQKKWEVVVSAAISEVERTLLKNYPGFHHTTFFGAMGIDPKHLAIWCFFTKDGDLKKAQEEDFTGDIQQTIREALRKHGYPGDLTPSVAVTFATDEEVQRSFGGNYWHFLK